MKRLIVSFTILLTLIFALTITIALSTPAQASGVNDNPWNYDFNPTGGKVITAPPMAFCGYFRCIPNFPHGVGYVVECRDQMFSRSGGVRGSCSRHKGEWRALYAHANVTSGSPSQPVSSNPPVSSGSGSTTSPGLPLTGSDPYTTH